MKSSSQSLTRRAIAARLVEKNLSVDILDANKQVENVLIAIRELLMSANPELRIELRDFGVFEVKLTKAKPRARNPKTGETVFVPAHRKTHFKPSKLLKSFLSQPLTNPPLVPGQDRRE